MKIFVHNNPNTKACPVADHFRENWVKNEKLHPDVKGIEVVIEDKAYGDSLVLVHLNDAKITLTGAEALRLDLFQERILEYLKTLD